MYFIWLIMKVIVLDSVCSTWLSGMAKLRLKEAIEWFQFSLTHLEAIFLGNVENCHISNSRP